MVPAQKILEVAREKQVDMIGLSGLITPSLEEMAHLAKEMQRLGFDIPLLIGGATTSRAHTAVKIEPGYQNGPTVWVKDASRAVGVAQNLITPETRAEFMALLRNEYEAVRVQHANRRAQTRWLTLDQARQNRSRIDWAAQTLPAPKDKNVLVFDDYSLAELAQYIDWTPFFHAWELAGSYPKIFDDALKGEEAKKLFADAQQMLTDVIKNRWLKARAVAQIFPANSVGDDVEVYTDETRNEVRCRFHFLRQQQEKPAGKHNHCLADFIAPKTTGVADYIGMFAVTAGEGIDEHVRRYEAEHDDYRAIMIKAIADRLAEAFAERLHQRIRKEFWGYAAEETLPNDALIDEKYAGIRPAPGYPACPDHTEKGILWDALDVEKRAGITITDSFAMTPTAAVSGFYFGNVEAQYFAVGKINRDQVEEYAKRKGMSLADAERWLAPNLGYSDN